MRISDWSSDVCSSDLTTPRSGSPLRIGTRGSLLATTQAGTVRDALIAAGHPAELVIIKTKGDQSTDPVPKIGVGVFTAELRAIGRASFRDRVRPYVYSSVVAVSLKK